MGEIKQTIEFLAILLTHQVYHHPSAIRFTTLRHGLSIQKDWPFEVLGHSKPAKL